MNIAAATYKNRSIIKLAIFSLAAVFSFSGAAYGEESGRIFSGDSLLRKAIVHDDSALTNPTAGLTGAFQLRAGIDSASPMHASYKMAAPEQRPSNNRPDAVAPRGGVFNSVPIAFGALPAKRRWQSTYAQIARGDVQCAGRCPTGAEALHLKVQSARDGSLLEKLGVVNRAVNDFVTYVPDRRNYGQLDYWASPEQTLRRGRGDCEDYAILKMAALTSLGVPATSMSLIVLLDRRRQVYHAVLAVSTSDGHFILDNLSRAVRRDTEIADYQPLFSFSGDRSWLHGQTANARVAAAPFKLSTQVSPGEGPATEETVPYMPVGKGMLARN